jgi:site-specific recombinase XerD
MQTNEQIKQEVISNIINRISPSFSQEQLQQLKSALDIELYHLTISKDTTEIVEYEDSGYLRYLAIFLNAKQIEGCSENTLERYNFVVRYMLDFFNKPVDKITTEDIRYYLAWYQQTRGTSLRTLDGMRCCISSFFTWLFREQYIPTNPMLRVHKIKFQKKVKDVLTDENLETLKATCTNDRDYAIIEFIYSTGVRVTELSKLNISDVDFQSYKILINGKGNKQRIVRMNGSTAIRLKMYLDSRTDDNPALFVWTKAPYNRIKKSGVEAMMRSLRKNSGIDQRLYPHALRTKFATDMTRHGAPIEHVAALLGHEDINTTRIYAIANNEDLDFTYNKCQY